MGLSSRIIDDLDWTVRLMATVALADTRLPTAIAESHLVLVHAASRCLIVRDIVCVSDSAVGVPGTSIQFGCSRHHFPLFVLSFRQPLADECIIHTVSTLATRFNKNSL